MQKLTSSLIFLLSTCLFALGQSDAPLPKEVIGIIQARVDGGLNTSIVVGLIDGGETRFYSYGKKSVNGSEKVDEHSVFEIGSISKTFTGILLAKGVLEGQFKLNDPIQSHLPEGIKAPTYHDQNIRLAALSNHTSSLPRMPSNFFPADPANPYADYSEKQLYEFISSVELTREIGSQYEYSNLAVGLLGQILSKKQEKSYEELLIDNIANPLGMDDTRVVFTKKMKENLAKGHSGGVVVSNWDLPTLAGAGAIRSTAVDMIKYLKANMGITKTDLYPAMELSHKNTRKSGENPMVGLGWHMFESNGSIIVWHNGGTGGYRTYAGFIKGGKRGVVVLSNSTESVDNIGMHLLDPTIPLNPVTFPIGNVVQKVIDEKGIEAGIKHYKKLKEKEAEKYRFNSTELNALGYHYMGKDELDNAIAIFQLNIEEYPHDFNTYDSMGEAYMNNKENAKAIANYKKSIEMNPNNTNGIEMLKKLGVKMEDSKKEITIADDILESYVGKYQLAPNFIITISKEGKQMKAQATGQPMFDIYPSAENKFYLTVVQAQVQFNKNDKGEVESLTLFQNGQQVPGPKIE